MAKKKWRKSSKPVQEKKKDDNVIRIHLGIHKSRAPIKPGQRFHSRSHDVLKGRRRHPKHKAQREY